MKAPVAPAAPSAPTTRKKTAHVAIILDRSGSMESCRDATISGFNEYAQRIRKTTEEEGLDARVTLTVFNHEVTVERFQEPLSVLTPIDRKTYVPDGMTAMLDAVGETIDRLLKEATAEHDTSFLVCIISDGLENASQRYTNAEIAERVQRLTRSERWTFTYLGSNQDLTKISHDLNIPVANVSAYEASPAGTSHAWARHTEASTRRLRRVSKGEAASQDFYAEDK